MSDPGDSRDHVPFCPEKEEERMEFLTTNYKYLFERIQARKFYPHLRSRGVIDMSDQHIIERENLADVQKAGGYIYTYRNSFTTLINEFLMHSVVHALDHINVLFGLYPYSLVTFIIVTMPFHIQNT